MRRMRSNWQYVLFAVPVIVVAAGITLVSKNRQSRNPASVAFAPSPPTVSGNGNLREMQKRISKKIAKLREDGDVPEQDLKVADAAAVSRGPASADFCGSEEFPGTGPEGAQISKKDWQSVMDQFHDAKTLLVAWLNDHKTQFSEKTYQWMKTRVSEARLQRPPNDEEPDLSWRGIGVVADQRGEMPLIRVGGGFAKLVTEKPKRARFEIARVLAQTWAPCELAKLDSTSPWKGLLTCLDLVNEADTSKSCGAFSYSEAGWAVSSAVAAIASPPGCRIPAFEKISAADCTKKMGTHL